MTLKIEISSFIKEEKKIHTKKNEFVTTPHSQNLKILASLPQDNRFRDEIWY